MAVIEIYYQNTKIGTEYFKREFYISERLSGELFWYTGENPKSGGGIFKVWIQMADTIPRIVSILPDWQLFINGIEQEPGFYDAVEDLAGKVVKLRYKDYLFVVNFAH